MHLDSNQYTFKKIDKCYGEHWARNSLLSCWQTETVEEPIEDDAEAEEEPEKDATEDEAEVEEEEEDKDKPKTKKVGDPCFFVIILILWAIEFINVRRLQRNIIS